MRKIFINRVEHGSVGVDERTCRETRIKSYSKLQAICGDIVYSESADARTNRISSIWVPGRQSAGSVTVMFHCALLI